MKFKTLIGSLKNIRKPKNYLIHWEGESKSKIQYKTKQFLKSYWKNHVVFEEFPMAGTKLSFDFYNANKKIVVEVQGRQHTKYVPYFHGKSKSGYLNQLRRDNDKLKFCELNGIKFVEIFSEEELSLETFEKYDIFL